MTHTIELLGGAIAVDSDELLARTQATDTDVVVLSGTLLEGFGNLYSDLDLYVICEELPENIRETPAKLIVREDGRIRRVNDVLDNAQTTALDIQYYTTRELDTLSRSLNTLYLESRLGTRKFRRTLHVEDEDLIHKLLTGRTLQGEPDNLETLRFFNPARFCFLKFRNEVAGYPEFRDLIGSWQDDDLDTCLFNIRGFLISQLSGMMFLSGSTNPRPKWFLRKLECLRDEYGDLRQRVTAWLFGARLTEQQKRKAIENACSLVDEAYSHTQRLLSTNPAYFASHEALDLTEREFSENKVRDPDTNAERQLRRRMFTAEETPLFAQLTTNVRREPAPALSLARSNPSAQQLGTAI